MKLSIAMFVLFMLTGLAMMCVSKCVPTMLPHRPDTGNHGQGHSPPADCPHQYRSPVEVDGQEYPLTCFGFRSISSFTEGLNTQKQVFDQEVIALRMLGNGKMSSSFVHVPSLPEYEPYICFILEGVAVAQCLYIAGDGEVQQIGISLDAKEI